MFQFTGSSYPTVGGNPNVFRPKTLVHFLYRPREAHVKPITTSSFHCHSQLICVSQEKFAVVMQLTQMH